MSIIFECRQEEIEFNNERLNSLLRISQYQSDSIQDMLDYALSEAIKLTKSKIGYIYFYDENKKVFILNTWSNDVMKECKIINPQTIYDLDKTGYWGEAVRQRRPVVLNDYAAENPLKKGIPDGHVQLTKFLSIPVFSDKRIVAVAGVANKEKDYDESDIRQLTLLMDTVWKISERMEMIETLKEAKQRAEEADELKTSFLCNISHEIRTPLNAIIGFSSLMNEPDMDQKDRDEYFKIIKSRSDDLLRIINDILDISKIESNQMQIRMTEGSLKDMMDDLFEYYRINSLGENKKEIVFTLQYEVEDKYNYILTDFVRVRQVLTNLLNNSIKFTHGGRIEFGCTLTDDNFIQFYVADTGIGIPEDKLEKIFERFRQLDISISRKYEGTGLGLSISKGILALLEGDIWVESKLNEGSIFYFTIPYNPIDTDELKTEIKIPRHESVKNKTVLIIEDDTFNMIYLEKILKSFEIKYYSASNGNSALSLFNMHTNIDLVLMDIQLPDISGYDLTIMMKKTRSGIPIIAQTGFAMEEDRRKCIEAGCDDFISKPMTKEKLYEKISQYLS